MEQPVRNEGAPALPPAAGELPSYLLSRDYENYLDWLENQRRSRTHGRRRGRFFGMFAACVSAFSLIGTLMRRHAER